MLFDLDEQTPVGQRVGSPGHTTVEALQNGRTSAAGQPDPIGNVSHGSDRGVFRFMAGDK
jgi:hypothetical protein